MSAEQDVPRGSPAAGTLWPLALYLALSIVLFGIPVIGHLGSHLIAADEIDSSAEIWFLAWWPHAVLHGIGPFVTHAMFYPEGYNLTWAASMPLPAIATAPVTLAFGPAVSWNVIQLLAPALSAWTAYLLCRDLVSRPLPSIVGGYVYGFSPYVLSHLTGSPMLALVPLPPVLVLLVRRSAQGRIGPRRFVVWVTLCLAAQYMIDGEVLAAGTLVGALVLALAYLLYRELRPALLQTLELLAVAYMAALVLVSPFLYFFVFGRHYPPVKTSFRADLAALVAPPQLVALRRHVSLPQTYAVETYLGVPLLALIGLLAWQQRRRRAAQLTTLSLLVAIVASLGRELVVGGHKTGIWLPWRLVEHLPALRYAIPVRLAVFASLAAAVIVAMWLTEPSARFRGVLRWGLAALAIAFIVPDVGTRQWDIAIADPPFFKHHAYRAYLSSRDHVLTVPAWGPNERWVADAGFPFALTAGYAGQRFPASYTRYPTWSTLLTGQLTSDYAAQLRRFIAAQRVTAIVVERGYPGPWRALFGTLGVRPVATGGVLLYRLRGGT